MRRRRFTRTTGMTLFEVVVSAAVAVVVLSVFAQAIRIAVDRATADRHRVHAGITLDRAIDRLRVDQSLHDGVEDSELSTCWYSESDGFGLGPFLTAEGDRVTHRFARRGVGWSWDRVVDDGSRRRAQRLITNVAIDGEAIDPVCRTRFEPIGDSLHWLTVGDHEGVSWKTEAGVAERARVVCRFGSAILLAPIGVAVTGVSIGSSGAPPMVKLTLNGVDRWMPLW